jgi:RNA polymerase sigma-70 factor, ECF subfamily
VIRSIIVFPEAVLQAHRAGLHAHPGIDLPLDTFAAFAAAREASWRGDPARAEDLFLACACAEGLPEAAAEFLRRFGSRIGGYLGRLADSEDLVAEVRQVVTVRCLVGAAGKPPAIAEYSAAGSLEGWVRATAVREALALRRDGARHDPLSSTQVLEQRLAGADRELEHLKSLYSAEVSRAFAAAAADLPAAQRTLLRLHYAHGLTTAHLARMYHVSRATLIRRLADARDALVGRVMEALRASAGVGANEFDSVLRLVKSQLDFTLSTLLRDPASTGP